MLISQITTAIKNLKSHESGIAALKAVRILANGAALDSVQQASLRLLIDQLYGPKCGTTRDLILGDQSRR